MGLIINFGGRFRRKVPLSEAGRSTRMIAERLWRQFERDPGGGGPAEHAEASAKASIKVARGEGMTSAEHY